MARLINLKTFVDERGSLTVIEKVIPFVIKRIFYIYGVDGSIRGQHRHFKTRHAVISIRGMCTIYNNNGEKEELFQLDMPNKCLILEPEDWHSMYNFSADSILIVFASEYFDDNDYIREPYSK